MKRRLIVAILAASIAVNLFGCGSESAETHTTEATSTEAITTEAVTEAEPAPAGLFPAEEVEAALAELDAEESGIEIQTFSETYRNDSTGNWRLARCLGSATADQYALNYYKAYFKNNDEIHVIINFSLGTTTRISSMAGLLFVDTYEYTDKEEHDANLALGGTHLASWQINTSTGDVEAIPVQ